MANKRLLRQTDDPGYARILGHLLTAQRDTAIPTYGELVRRALISQPDIRAAQRTIAIEQHKHPEDRDWLILGLLIAVIALQMRANAQAYRMGKITAAAWLSAQLMLIKRVQLSASILAHHGSLTADQTNQTQAIIRQQFAYARQFGADILSGKQRANGRIDTRAVLYAAAARGTYTALSRQQAARDGMRYERNVLNAVEDCPGCIEQSDLGWVPIGTLSQPGTRQCLAHCQCEIEFETTMHPHLREVS